MKSYPFPRILAVLCSIVLPLLAGRLDAASVPLWTLTVPPATFSSTSSVVTSITSDVAGNAFVVISHSTTTNVGGIPSTMPAGVQLFLLNPKGKILASGDFTDFTSVVPLQVTSRRVVAFTGGLILFTIGAENALVATPLNLETMTEAPEQPGPLPLDRKYQHSSTTAASKVTEVRRYTLAKLKP